MTPTGNTGDRGEQDSVSPAVSPISPRREMGAYEALWMEPGASVRSIAARFAAQPGALPSDLVLPHIAEVTYESAASVLAGQGVRSLGIRVHGAGDYPLMLRDAKEPVELLYYRGTWEFAQTPSVAVVGSRKPSADGIARAKRITKLLVEHRYTVVSGLAEGIDTAVHHAAIDAGGHTIAVLGTSIGSVYPRSNRDLQEELANKHLVISQVPILRYEQQSFRLNRLFFLERNKTMSALTLGTIIVEAGETSGTLTQARAALQQGRKLFILDSLLQRPDLTWPRTFLERGAIRVQDIDDVVDRLGSPPSP